MQTLAAAPALTLVPRLAKATQREADPIFAAIKAYKRAEKEWMKLADLADEFQEYRPSVATFPEREIHTTRVEDGDQGFTIVQTRGGPTGRLYSASTADEIERDSTAIPEEHREHWIADRRAALAREIIRARRENAASGYTAAVRARDKAYENYIDVGWAMAETVPTTPAGMEALLAEIKAYWSGCALDTDCWPYTALETIARASIATMPSA
jgi:hypothetical protein